MSLERNYFLLFVLPLYKVATQQEAVGSRSLMEAQSVYLLSPLRYRLVLCFFLKPGTEIIHMQKQKQIASISWHGQLPKGSLFFFFLFSFLESSQSHHVSEKQKTLPEKYMSTMTVKEGPYVPEDVTGMGSAALPNLFSRKHSVFLHGTACVSNSLHTSRAENSLLTRLDRLERPVVQML